MCTVANCLMMLVFWAMVKTVILISFEIRYSHLQSLDSIAILLLCTLNWLRVSFFSSYFILPSFYLPFVNWLVEIVAFPLKQQNNANTKQFVAVLTFYTRKQIYTWISTSHSNTWEIFFMPSYWYENPNFTLAFIHVLLYESNISVKCSTLRRRCKFPFEMENQKSKWISFEMTTIRHVATWHLRNRSRYLSI